MARVKATTETTVANRLDEILKASKKPIITVVNYFENTKPKSTPCRLDEILEANKRPRQEITNHFVNAEQTATQAPIEYKPIIDNPEVKELKNAIADLKQKKNTALETIPNRRKVEQIDDDYINRLDKILEMFGDEPMSLDKLAQFDEEMANAYKTLLARDAKDSRLSEKALLKTDNLHHNEAIVSDVEVGPIYTTNLNTIPIEYLELAQTKPTTFLLVNQ